MHISEYLTKHKLNILILDVENNIFTLLYSLELENNKKNEKKIQVNTFKIQNFTTLQILSGVKRILLQIYSDLVFKVLFGIKH